MTRPANVNLTDREGEVLVRMANGETYARIARDLGCSDRTASWIGQQVMRKLGAKSIAQAVHLAHIAGLLGPEPQCGSRAAYLRHLRRGEDCDPCRAANARHGVAQRAGRLRPQQARDGP